MITLNFHRDGSEVPDRRVEGMASVGEFPDFTSLQISLSCIESFCNKCSVTNCRQCGKHT